MGSSILSVMDPVVMTDAVLTSTTVSEADYAAWLVGTTYAAGDRVIVLSTHRIYESAQAANTGNDPTDIENRTGSSIWWIDISATNAWKMFDDQVSSPTEDSSPMTIVVEPGFISSLAMLGLEADTAQIDMLDAPAGSSIFSRTITLESSRPPDYYEYFYSPFEQQPNLIIDDLPPFSAAELTVTLTSTTTIKCGMMQIGDLRPLGATIYGAKAIPKSFSSITVDSFGDNTITRRKSAKDVSVTAIVEIGRASTVVDIVTDNLDKTVVWVASPLDDYSGLIAFGLGSGELSYDGPSHAILTVDIKGLI